MLTSDCARDSCIVMWVKVSGEAHSIMILANTVPYDTRLVLSVLSVCVRVARC